MPVDDSPILPAQPGWVIDYEGYYLTVIAWKAVPLFPCNDPENRPRVLRPMVYQPELGYADVLYLKDGSSPVARRLVKDPHSKQWV